MTDSVLFELRPTANGRQIAVATLNAEKSLNALSLPMIRLLNERLGAWRDDPKIICVLLQGAGEKAFCAGGDVVAMHQAIREGDFSKTDAFFREEYALDYLIHTYPKPVLAWGHGIVMGGGLGLLAGASHRVVTERSRIAMPEITIGLYPDVGGSWFLNRLPGKVGLYLGLTGASLNAADALFLGLADISLPASARTHLPGLLSTLEWSGDSDANRRILSRALRDLAANASVELAPSEVRARWDAIRALTDYDSVDDMVEVITRYQGSDDWLRQGAQKLASGSPTSIRLIAETQRRAKHMSLREVFDMELAVSCQCCRHPDFAEGVRALLVDKDGKPAWSPAALHAVSSDYIAGFFVQPV
ncbi:enoyl-CoA hydratase/isomerase family protein [Chitinimonas sp. BJYL2]|uniref:enoyl-CoA hydratase/isomerase family protein n=1 Tax=Chitinimonas sp. BJYL2 TaxID=2976696 RepID=UPI0022B4519E|nr:enoyl-CoA hydratase/isomerase family protein [Chitinimonas sp. BJYL2]